MAEEFIEVGAAIPRIASARPLDDRFISVTWRDGRTQQVDLKPALASHRAFVRVRSDDALFQRLKVSEFGDCLEWADGSELAASWIEELADAGLDNAGFRQAMDTLEMSLDGMAARLGIARRLIADYRKDKPIPKHIVLATRYLLDQRKAG